MQVACAAEFYPPPPFSPLLGEEEEDLSKVIEAAFLEAVEAVGLGVEDWGFQFQEGVLLTSPPVVSPEFAQGKTDEKKSILGAGEQPEEKEQRLFWNAPLRETGEAFLRETKEATLLKVEGASTSKVEETASSVSEESFSSKTEIIDFLKARKAFFLKTERTSPLATEEAVSLDILETTSSKTEEATFSQTEEIISLETEEFALLAKLSPVQEPEKKEGFTVYEV